MLRCGSVYEKGHGSAMDIIRRNWVRQISERDLGIFDMVITTTTNPEDVFHSRVINKLKDTNFQLLWRF